MTINEWLRQAEKQLTEVGIGTGRLDALVLLEDTTGRDRAGLLAEPDEVLTPPQATKLAKLLKRRATHEPLAYIRGFTEFYGRNFVITPAVLEPRPESETMIELLKSLRDRILHTPQGTKNGLSESETALRGRQNWRIADVGSGSGALGVTAKLELPEARVELLEIDPQARAVAQINVDKFTLNLPVIATDLLTGSAGNYDILLCNLPYVPDDYRINEAAAQEPAVAIFGGPDGLQLYQKLFQQLAVASKPPLFILTESLPPQHRALAELAIRYGYQEQQEADFIQLFARS